MGDDLNERMARAGIGTRTLSGEEVGCLVPLATIGPPSLSGEEVGCLETCSPGCCARSGDGLAVGSRLQACSTLGMLAEDVDDSFHVLLV